MRFQSIHWFVMFATNILALRYSGYSFLIPDSSCSSVVPAALPSLGWQLGGDAPLRVRRSRRNTSVVAGRDSLDGHAFGVSLIDGLESPAMALDAHDLRLVALRFRTPSEHKVAGRRLDGEMQPIHVRAPTVETLDGAAARPESALSAEPPRRIASAFLEQAAPPSSIPPHPTPPHPHCLSRAAGSGVTGATLAKRVGAVG